MALKPQYLVVGLGRFGSNLALTLEESGCEVLGLDSNEDAVDQIAGQITHSMIADCTEEKVYREIGVDHFDMAICAIGTDFQASLMAVLLLRENGARRIVAKASNHLHGKVLERVGADRVVYPERDMAVRLARDILEGSALVEVLPLSLQQSIFEVKAPAHFFGINLAGLGLRARYGLNVVGIKRESQVLVSPGPGEMVKSGDILIVVGDRQGAEKAMETQT